MVIEQCFLAEPGLYRKAAVPAAPLRGLGCLLCYTRSEGSVSLCEAEIISLKGEILSAAQRQMKYPARFG